MEREVFVVFFIDHGKVPIRVLPTRLAAELWCVTHAEAYLARKKHPRSGVNKVARNEIMSLGYDIIPTKMEE